jgi:branched-chain amino acid transport system permease protein
MNDGNNLPSAPPTAAAKIVFGDRMATASDTKRRWSEMWQGQPKPLRSLIGLIGIAFLYYLPVPKRIPIITTTGTDFASLLAGSVVIFVIVALGLNVVVGMAGLLDLGYVGFYAVGAYVVGVLSSQHANIPWLYCLPIAVVVSMLSGVLLGAPTLRLRGDYLAIVTLGFGEIIRLLAQRFDWLGATPGISKIPPPPSIDLPFPPHHIHFGVLDSKSFYWLGLTLAIIVYFFLNRLEKSRVGRAWTAIREDEDAAELMGVPTFKFKLWAFAIGAAVGGLAGTLYATKTAFIQPDNFQLKLSILFLAAVVLGGPGNMPGVVLGAVVVSYLPERFRFLDTKRYYVFGLALVLMMIFRPEGLWPRRQHGRRASGAPPGGAGTRAAELASWNARAKAGLVDLAILVACAVPGLLAIVTRGYKSRIVDFVHFNLVIVFWIAIVAYPVVYARKTASGGTWGHRFAGVAVVDVHTGAPLTPSTAFQRWVVRFVSTVAVGLGFVRAGENRRTWHDRLAKSVVIVDSGTPTAELESPPPPFEDVREGDPDLEGGAHGTATA